MQAWLKHWIYKVIARYIRRMCAHDGMMSVLAISFYAADGAMCNQLTYSPLTLMMIFVLVTSTYTEGGISHYSYLGFGHETIACAGSLTAFHAYGWCVILLCFSSTLVDITHKWRSVSDWMAAQPWVNQSEALWEHHCQLTWLLLIEPSQRRRIFQLRPPNK